MEFHAAVHVNLALPAPLEAVVAYLGQPKYLVNALKENSQVTILRNFPFTCRLEMRPLELLQWVIQPTVDLRLEPIDRGVVLRSIATAIKGIDWIDQRFALNLFGTLIPQSKNKEETILAGKAQLCIHVELPTLVQLCPPLLLQTTGDRVVSSVLESMKHRLEKNLLQSYGVWEKSQPVFAKIG